MARPKKDIEGIRKTFVNNLANTYKIGSFRLGLSGCNELAYVLSDDRNKPSNQEINGHIYPSNNDFF